ncbi:UNVERIFIED_CONTAM: hypothetical protein Slati_3081100 [Sesamum latifolium]|uniref:Reverse transcriptase domain-containing protein n=1 Tax=Sesamum latifolium TaxID=2727402 RepID=A0AAW2UUD0_9LAMI
MAEDTREEVKAAFFDIAEDKSLVQMATHRPFSKQLGRLWGRRTVWMIISPTQNAFVPGRKIGDNVMLAQELFMGYNQRHLPKRCALKVDLRKAYDTVEWDFLIEVLRLFGFPDRFIGWIEECVTTATFRFV